jgi:TonB-linked SusC/RagA family outer membrane protein
MHLYTLNNAISVLPRWLRQTLLVMRITTLILITTLLQVSAASFGQKVTIVKNNIALSEVFKEIRKQTGYNVLWQPTQVNATDRVNLNMRNQELKEALGQILKGKQLDFSIEEETVMIKEKEAGFFGKIIARFQTIDVKGRVVDEKGEPLVSASVSVKGGNGTTTDKDGNFYLAKVDEKAVLLVSYIGYLSKEIRVNEDLSTIMLEISNSKLDEVKVIAYGTTTDRFSTSNIGTVKAADIAKQPVSNPLLALQGRVPGLFIEQASGVSGDGVKVTIQGTSSLQNGNDPFYVIDGVPYSPTFGSASLGGQAFSQPPSALSFINPADIESISILKDADATSIYGSRAANGAILITTKKGKAGKTKVDFNLQNGWGQIDHKLKLLNTQQYLEMRKDAYKNDGLPVPTSVTAPSTSNYDLTVWDQNSYTDWQKVLVGGTANFTDIQTSVSGGSPLTQFFVGYGYNRQTSVYPNSLADVKGDIHLNLNHSSLGNKFKYLISATYLHDKNQLNFLDLMRYAVTLAPNAPAFYDAAGNLNWEVYPNNPNRYSFRNPLAFSKQQYTGYTNNLTANNTTSYEIANGVEARVSAGYNKLEGDETSIVPLISLKPDGGVNTRSATYLTKSMSSWIIEPQLEYQKNTKFGAIDFLLGATFQQNKTDLLSQTGSGYSDDSQLLNIQSASSITINSVVKTLYKYDAIFARLNYRLEDKYILNLTARRDGSSRFGDLNKMHTFYALGGAWLFSEEHFIKDNLSWISSGKIRVNYGTTGSDQITDYTYQSLLDIYHVDLPYQGGVGLYPTSIYNPFLQWEETRKLNIGANVGILKDRIQLDINYFRNRSSNQLIGYSLPTTTGFYAITENFPATVQNGGWEVLLNLTPIKSQNITWQASANFTSPRNKLIAFPGLATSTYSDSYVIGQPINVIRAYKFAGVNPTSGLYQFVDHKGNLTSSPDPATDRTVLVDPNPKWYLGFNNNLTYKGFELDFLVQIVNQMAQNYRFGKLSGFFNPTSGNQPIEILDRWKTSGDNASVQKFSGTTQLTNTPYFDAVQSDASFSGASYIRLKNASLSYTLPQQFTKKACINNARIYIQGQNLITVTKFIGTDPESRSIASLPPLRIFTVGLQVTL